MKKHFSGLIFLTLLGLILSSSAQASCDPGTSATPCAGLACEQLGASMIDSDKKSIVTCLLNDAGAQVWKSGQQTKTKISSRSVYCNAVSMPFAGSPKDVGCTAVCDDDEVVTGGGFSWGNVFSDKGRYLQPQPNGMACLINVGSCSGGGPTCGSGCYAICTKIE